METLLKNLRNGGSKALRDNRQVAAVLVEQLDVAQVRVMQLDRRIEDRFGGALQIVMRRIDVQRRDIRTAGLVEVASVVLNLLAQDNVEQ